MLFVKLHESYRTVIAVCDSDLIGKRFEEEFENGIKQLDLRENFYKNEELSFEQAVQLMKSQSAEDATFNIVGKKAVKAAKEAGLYCVIIPNQALSSADFSFADEIHKTIPDFLNNSPIIQQIKASKNE